MKKITPKSIGPERRAWFGNQIQSLAMRHDLVGPGIRRVNEGDYKNQLVEELRSRAAAAMEAKELCVAEDEVHVYCTLAAEELFRIRQIHAAHKAGELPAEVLRQLPAYVAFRDYFDERPSVVHDEAIAVARYPCS